MNKKMKLLTICTILAIGISIKAADHIDAPAVKGSSADITDFYAFQGENTDNLVFVANVQGLLAPSATGDAQFDENVLVEFNIDNDGDFFEDLVIQAIPRGGKMYFFGPYAPAMIGSSSKVNTDAPMGSVNISTYGNTAVIADENQMKYFAGPRDDPFFMDFAQFGKIVGGMASGFNNPGDDTFAGTNVLSIVVEVPKSKLGGSGTLNTWVTANSK